MYSVRQWLPALFLTWATSVLSSPLAVSNPSSLSSPKINLTDITHTFANLSEIDIPQDFKLHLQSQFPSYQPEEAYFYNTIMALRKVALEDFNGVMPGQHFNTNKFPKTPINLVARWGQIQRKYVVWGLLPALAFMTEETGLCVTSFRLLWQEGEIGSVGFGIPGTISRAPEGRSNGTESTTQNHVPSIDGFNLTNSPATLGEPASDADLTEPLNTNRVTVAIARSGGDLRKYDVLMGIAGALAEAAEKPAEHRINYDWSSQLWNFNCRFATKQVTPVRTAPLVYTFRVLIDSLVQVADYYIRVNAYHEISMITKVDRVMVGISKLVHRTDWPLLGPGNQSTPVGSTA